MDSKKTKINILPLMICLIISALIAYLFHRMYVGSNATMHWLITVITFIHVIQPLVVVFSLKIDNQRVSNNIIIFSFVFLIIGLLIISLFVFWFTSIIGFIISLGLFSNLYSFVIQDIDF